VSAIQATPVKNVTVPLYQIVMNTMKRYANAKRVQVIVITATHATRVLTIKNLTEKIAYV
jgi:hypothetical protein